MAHPTGPHRFPACCILLVLSSANRDCKLFLDILVSDFCCCVILWSIHFSVNWIATNISTEMSSYCDWCLRIYLCQSLFFLNSKVPGHQCVEIRFLLHTFNFRQLLSNFFKEKFGFFVVASLCVYVDFYFKTVPSQLEFHPRQIAETHPSKSILIDQQKLVMSFENVQQ
jgi:hypothetical protein